jgi:hypothetical protein
MPLCKNEGNACFPEHAMSEIILAIDLGKCKGVTVLIQTAKNDPLILRHN